MDCPTLENVVRKSINEGFDFYKNKIEQYKQRGETIQLDALMFEIQGQTIRYFWTNYIEKYYEIHEEIAEISRRSMN
jgi:hypothetical protein